LTNTHISTFQAIAESLLPKLSQLVHFRLANKIDNCKVQLDRETEPQPARLEVLWLQSLWNFPISHPNLFTSLVSLQVGSFYGCTIWRSILVNSASTLKHLNINLEPQEEEEDEDVETLHFPILQVLEIKDWDGNFPSWLSFPSTTKVSMDLALASLPSVSELWLDLASRCPTLKSIRLDYLDSTSVPKLLDLLKKRNENVDAGSERDGVKMEKLKRLAIPFKSFDDEMLEECRDLVGEVVDSASEPRNSIVVL